MPSSPLQCALCSAALAHAMATRIFGKEPVASASAIDKPKRARSASPAAISPPAAATARSFLDRLQRDAHGNELEPGNASPAFLVAALCQYALPERFGTAAALSLALTGPAFSCRWLDVTDDIAYLWDAHHHRGLQWGHARFEKHGFSVLDTLTVVDLSHPYTLQHRSPHGVLI